MNDLLNLQRILNSHKQESLAVDALCIAMERVGGYEQLMELYFPTLHEILESIERREKEEQKKWKFKHSRGRMR